MNRPVIRRDCIQEDFGLCDQEIHFRLFKIPTQVKDKFILGNGTTCLCTEDGCNNHDWIQILAAEQHGNVISSDEDDNKKSFRPRLGQTGDISEGILLESTTENGLNCVPRSLSKNISYILLSFLIYLAQFFFRA